MFLDFIYLWHFYFHGSVRFVGSVDSISTVILQFIVILLSSSTYHLACISKGKFVCDISPFH